MIYKKILSIIVSLVLIGAPTFAYATLDVEDLPSTVPATIDEICISTIDEAEVLVTENPTEKVTEKPTETQKPTETPTSTLTEAPTESPTELLLEDVELETENDNPCAPVPPDEPNTGLNPSTSDSVYNLSDDERHIVECLVMGEAGYMSYELQVLTAQCILNACLESNLPPSDIMNIYQYFGWNNVPTESVKSAVSAVFDNGYRLTSEPILYFYAPHLCYSEWHESQRYILTQDGIRFFAKW